MAAQGSWPTSFLSLPAELRVKIYNSLGPVEFTMRSLASGISFTAPTVVGFLRCCKLVYYEASPILAEKTTLYVQGDARLTIHTLPRWVFEHTSRIVGSNLRLKSSQLNLFSRLQVVELWAPGHQESDFAMVFDYFDFPTETWVDEYKALMEGRFDQWLVEDTLHPYAEPGFLYDSGADPGLYWYGNTPPDQVKIHLVMSVHPAQVPKQGKSCKPDGHIIKFEYHTKTLLERRWVDGVMTACPLNQHGKPMQEGSMCLIKSTSPSKEAHRE